MDIYNAWRKILEGEAKKYSQGLTLGIKEGFRGRCVYIHFLQAFFCV